MLGDGTTLVPEHTYKDSSIFGFDVVTPDRTYLLSASSESERSRWCDAIDAVLNPRQPTAVETSGDEAASANNALDSAATTSTATTAVAYVISVFRFLAVVSHC